MKLTYSFNLEEISEILFRYLEDNDLLPINSHEEYDTTISVFPLARNNAVIAIELSGVEDASSIEE